MSEDYIRKQPRSLSELKPRASELPRCLSDTARLAGLSWRRSERAVWVAVRVSRRTGRPFGGWRGRAEPLQVHGWCRVGYLGLRKLAVRPVAAPHASQDVLAEDAWEAGVGP